MTAVNSSAGSVETAPPAAAIIIPAFNASATIGDTLRSVQSCEQIDEIRAVYVCDDASSDDTVEAAKGAWKGAPKLVIERNKENLGERRTVNAAIERLSSEFPWVLILHADDVVKENWIRLYFDRMRIAEPRVASICSSYDCWYPALGRTDPGEDDFTRDLEIISGSQETVLSTLKTGCWWHISGCAIRTDCFREIGGFQPHMPQLGDFEWLLRCLKLGYDIEYIPRTTMLYRMHPKSVSSKSFSRGQDLIERMEIFQKYCNEGYLPRRALRSLKLNTIYTAAKRIAKQLAAGRIQECGNLCSVCWRTLVS